MKASVGHVKDLPKSKIGVDVENGFDAAVRGHRGQGEGPRRDQERRAQAESVFLATDPDREGEAIAWHIAEEIGDTGDGRIQRVLFNEITKKGVQKAIEKPRELDLNKSDAQQARRILDRLVGYEISPILWNKVRRGLSAGRVQSVAVRLVVEREREIEAFIPEEYWTVEARARREAAAAVRGAARRRWTGEKAEPKDGDADARDRRRSSTARPTSSRASTRRSAAATPPPPFITAKLQQEARATASASRRSARWRSRSGSTKASSSARRARSVSSRTCVPTPTALSDDAVAAVRDVHRARRYGEDYLPEAPNVYKTKEARAGRPRGDPPDARWSGRPTRVATYFEQIGERDMFRLYTLIWNRFVASQMVPAVYDQTTVDIDARPRHVPRDRPGAQVRRLHRGVRRSRRGGGRRRGRRRRRTATARRRRGAPAAAARGRA